MSETRSGKSPEQMRRVVERLLRGRWRKRSTRWLADEAGVSWSFADKVRTEFEKGSVLDLKRESKKGVMYVRHNEKRKISLY